MSWMRQPTRTSSPHIRHPRLLPMGTRPPLHAPPSAPTPVPSPGLWVNLVVLLHALHARQPLYWAASTALGSSRRSLLFSPLAQAAPASHAPAMPQAPLFPLPARVHSSLPPTSCAQAASSRQVSDASSEGLSTAVQPAASAGATFHCGGARRRRGRRAGTRQQRWDGAPSRAAAAAASCGAQHTYLHIHLPPHAPRGRSLPVPPSVHPCHTPAASL